MRALDFITEYISILIHILNNISIQIIFFSIEFITKLLNTAYK